MWAGYIGDNAEVQIFPSKSWEIIKLALAKETNQSNVKASP